MNDEQMYRLLKDLRSLRAKKETFERKARRLQDKLLEEFERRDAIALEIEDVRASYIQAERVEYHADKLKEELPASMYRRVIKHVVDPSRLEEQVLAGSISTEVINKCSTVKINRPYIKLGKVRTADED